jgi:hypothetical protein
MGPILGPMLVSALIHVITSIAYDAMPAVCVSEGVANQLRSRQQLAGMNCALFALALHPRIACRRRDGGIAMSGWVVLQAGGTSPTPATDLAKFNKCLAGNNKCVLTRPALLRSQIRTTFNRCQIF